MSSKRTASPAVLAHNFRVARRITFDSQDHAGYSVGQFQRRSRRRQSHAGAMIDFWFFFFVALSSTPDPGTA